MASEYIILKYEEPRARASLPPSFVPLWIQKSLVLYSGIFDLQPAHGAYLPRALLLTKETPTERSLSYHRTIVMYIRVQGHLTPAAVDIDVDVDVESVPPASAPAASYIPGMDRYQSCMTSSRIMKLRVGVWAERTRAAFDVTVWIKS